MSQSSPQSPLGAAQREEEMQYGSQEARRELDEKYPNRPHNHSKTLLFSDLYKDLFNPLNENKRQPTGGPSSARSNGSTTKGPRGKSKLSPQEQRRHIIDRFITRWRKQVGNDFYPALRLILPDKDRDRGVYGLKENAIAKLLVKLINIDKNSPDGYALLHWKLPGQTTASRLAGDFAGRCFETISKRPLRTEPGDMTVAEVNHQLDKLAASSGEAENLRVFDVFYRRMNAEDMMWLIRIILRQLKVGATEKTLLHLWHPDGEALFSVSSSLRRVCWELHDPSVRLEQEGVGIALMQCFQPQLAQFQMPASFQKMITLLRPTPDDAEFWIEEKLDGERMQMHMVDDAAHPGGKRFCFWSRKAKEYTYLYGNGFMDANSSLTRHLQSAFASGVRNIILDGEMITWDMAVDKIVPFGTLKTAAIAEQQNHTGSDYAGHRPLFRVFDILYLNDKQLTQYTLRDRRRALERAVNSVHRRLEIHSYTSATSADAIEPLLRDVVANASEGLVLKNPRSMYRLNSRNDDWLKVKPEYMSEFGESLDCLIIGGYYGSGKRGGTLGSFLCGLRASPNQIQAGADPEKCFSFFRVGGGFRAEDYAEIRHRTEGKWMDWDAKNPPSQYVELGGGAARQHERPDVWIRPRDSVVVSVKATSVGPSDSYAQGYTLRFPRFRRLRLDRAWDGALSVEEFQTLRQRAEQESKEKAMTVEDRKRRNPKRVKRELKIVGGGGDDFSTAPSSDVATTRQGGRSAAAARLFEGLEFCVLSESLKPRKQSKAELETVIKAHGGVVSQRAVPGSRMVIVADKKVVKVASLMKQGGDVDIIRPRWIQDCIAQCEADAGGGGGGANEDGVGFLLPYETAHLFHATEKMRLVAEQNTDRFGDPFARDLSVEELRVLMGDMKVLKTEEDDDDGFADPCTSSATAFDKGQFLDMLAERGRDLAVPSTKGLVFRRCVVHLASMGGGKEGLVDEMERLKRYIRFGGGAVVDGLDGGGTTHVVLVGTGDGAEAEAEATEVRRRFGVGEKLPRLVGGGWVEACWRESCLVDEERYSV